MSLEKKLLKLSFSLHPSEQKLPINLDIANINIDKLRKTPKFLSLKQRNTLQEKLDSQADLLQELENSNQSSGKSCDHISQLKQGLIKKNNTTIFVSGWATKNQLEPAINDLFDSSILYCNSQNIELIASIEEGIKTIDNLLDQQNLAQYRIITTEFTNYSRNLVKYQTTNNNIFAKIKLEQVINGLQEIEEYYLEQYQKSIYVLGLYRLLCVFYILIIIVFVAYRVIGHLSKTNFNFVKILEGLTQELETKVEQRTALLEESIQNTESALAQAQNANKAKSTFLANISHELRTPLNAILGFTQLMCRDTSVSHEHQENLKIINRSGEHLLRLINDILEMSKIEVGQITLNEASFDLYTMLSSLEQMLQLKVQTKNIALIFQIRNEDLADSSWQKQMSPSELSAVDLAVMSGQWRSQLYEAASKVDNQEIYQLLREIPDEYEFLVKGIENLVEEFRCDKIIDLAKSSN